MKLITTAFAAIFAGLLAAGAAQAQPITGAGSTFAAPIYGKWGEAGAGRDRHQAELPGDRLGRGQNQINNRTVDFGASDMPVDGRQA